MRFGFFLLLLLIFACVPAKIREREKPENLIPEDKMILLIKDISVLETYIKYKIPDLNQSKDITIKSVDAILKKHQVDSTSYSNSLEYYGSRHEQMQNMYSKALELVNLDLAKEEAKK